MSVFYIRRFKEAILNIATKFGFCLVGEYLIAAFLFGRGHNWQKMVYFIACAIKDVSVLLL